MEAPEMSKHHVKERPHPELDVGAGVLDAAAVVVGRPDHTAGEAGAVRSRMPWQTEPTAR
ncbi:hypothetical protein GCM10022236_45330 [Microlunatus ginsengisoli]|uniref:Uncharacterized protein n=1 Tax=Microlunatus ginsengisoli TaxID=363863 RepID=A0ABP7AQV2_9ACTN